MSALARWIREPLVQFAAIGLLVFAVERSLRPEAQDPNLIQIDHEQLTEFATLFEALRNRRPSAAEMDEMVETFIQNEVLYREARSLRLDLGDDTVRERLAQRMRLMMYSGITVDDPGDAALRAFFEERPERYQRPQSISFSVIGVDGDEAEATEVATAAEERVARGEVVDPADYTMVTFEERPRPQVEQLFDEAFIAAIAEGPVGVWRIASSPRGWQAVELIALSPAYAPGFAEAREAVLNDWRNREIQRKAIAALDALRDDYVVERAPYTPDVVAEPTTGVGVQ